MAGRTRRRRGGDHGGGGGGGGHGGASGRWLVSYADFITLMFVVFVVLFAFGKADLAKFGTLAKSLRSAMGPAGPDLTGLPVRSLQGEAAPVVPPEKPGGVDDLPDWSQELITPVPEGTRPVIPPVQPPKETPPVTEPKPADTTPPAITTPSPQKPPPDPMSGLAKAFQDLPGTRSGVLIVALQEQGIQISVAGSVLFEPGQTKLKVGALGYLDSVAATLEGVEHPIMVRGMADEESSSTLSRWDMAALRAGEVVRYLVEQKQMAADKFVTIGYGGGGAGGEMDRYVHIVVMRKNGTP